MVLNISVLQIMVTLLDALSIHTRVNYYELFKYNASPQHIYKLHFALDFDVFALVFKFEFFYFF